MGSVKVDIKRGEYEFHSLTLSDVDTIKALIANKSILDKFSGLTHDIRFDKAGDIQKFNAELDCLYLSLDETIKKAKLNDRQRKLLELIMEDGMRFSEVSEEEFNDEYELYGQSQDNINKMLNRICAKIKKANDEAWKAKIGGVKCL